MELHYFYRPTSLTAGAGSGTTWLSENAEITLLYGSLIEAYTYMKGEPDMMQEYEKRFAEGVIAMKNFGEAKKSPTHTEQVWLLGIKHDSRRTNNGERWFQGRGSDH